MAACKQVIKEIKPDEQTVLYIEDNPADLRLVSQLLGRIPNVKICSALEPFLGIELAKTQKPDLILVDINLPSMDGFELLEILRKQETSRKKTIIAISANAMPRDIEKAKHAGFDNYITKPINVELLLQTVNEQLNNIQNKLFNGLLTQ